MNSREVSKFIKNAVKDLFENDRSSTYHLKLDNNFALYVGWSGGFDEEDEGVLHSKSQPEYCVSVKVAEYRPWDCADYDWCYMPWDTKTEEVWDTDCAVSKKGDYYQTAKWLLKEYREMRKALKKGEITFGN